MTNLEKILENKKLKSEHNLKLKYKRKSLEHDVKILMKELGIRKIEFDVGSCFSRKVAIGIFGNVKTYFKGFGYYIWSDEYSWLPCNDECIIEALEHLLEKR
jgi:hypothetical protein